MNKFNNVIVIGIESDTLGDKTFENDIAQIEYNNIKKDYIYSNKKG